MEIFKTDFFRILRIWKFRQCQRKVIGSQRTPNQSCNEQILSCQFFPVSSVSLQGFVNVDGILGLLSYLSQSHSSENPLTFTGLLLTYISVMEH